MSKFRKLVTLAIVLLLSSVVTMFFSQTANVRKESETLLFPRVIQEDITSRPPVGRVIAPGVIQIDGDYNQLVGLPPGGWKTIFGKRTPYKKGTPGVVEYEPES